MNPRINYRFGAFVLRPGPRELTRDGQTVALTSRVFDCLVYLIEHRDRAVGRDELCAAVWGRADVSDAQLSQAILRARRAFDDGGNGQAYIRTMPKFGYGWVATTEAFVEAAPPPRTESVEPAAAVAPPPAEPEGAMSGSAAAPIDDADADAGEATTARPRRRRAMVLALAALALVAVAVGAWWHARQPAGTTTTATAPRGVLILPVDVDPAASANWIHLGAIDTIADRMRAAGVPVPPSETTLALLGADVAGKASATLRARADATWIVASSAMRSARGWKVRLSASNAGGTTFSSEIEDADVIDAFHSCTDKLLEQLGYAPPGEALLAHGVEEALQRVQAALLENDLDGARRVLQESPALAADPAEMQFQTAQIDYRQGHLDVAAATIKRVLGEDGIAQRPWLAARAWTLGGSIDLMLDDGTQAERAFDHSLALLDRTLHPLDYARALSGRGAARTTLGRYDAGATDIGAARMQLQQSGDLLAQARIDLLMGSAEFVRGRPLQARGLLEASLRSLQRFGAWNERMHAYSVLVQCNIELLDYSAAAQASDDAYALLPKVAAAPHRAEMLINRIEVSVLQGRLADTTDLFAALDALGFDPPRTQGLEHAMRAWLAAARNDHATAIRESDSAIALLPANESEVASRTVLVRTRAQLADGAVDAASDALARLPEALRGNDAPLAVAIAHTEVAARKRQAVDADYQSILARADASAIPYERLLAVESRVTTLLDAGRPAEAEPLLGQLAAIAGQDFRFALLELRLNHVESKVQAWKASLDRATALAGERTIPPGLASAPL